MLRAVAIFTVALPLAACGKPASYNRQIHTVEDLANRHTIVLSRPVGDDHVVGLYVRVFGEIAGTASVSLMLNGQPYQTAELSNTFDDVLHSGDWYSDTAEIEYQPGSSAQGRLSFEYEFESL